MTGRDAATAPPETRTQTPTRAQAIAQVVDFLASAGVEEARAQEDARALLRAAAGLTRLELAMAPQVPLLEEHARALSHFAARRAAREPVSRILGERGFWTLDLVVAPQVFDPRPDTETLIETTLALIGENRDAPLTILDLGAGSGALVCALLKELPSARGVAVDLSSQACQAARENLARCGLSRRAAVLRSRWGDALMARFDIIVSNPPYIRADDIAGLEPEVRLHDPALALNGGEDGLDCYRAIIADLPRLLKENGLVAFEVGADQAVEVASLLGARGFAIERIGRDLGGRERAVVARQARSRS